MRSGFTNVWGGGSKCPGSHTSAGSLSFKKLLIGGYEWVRIQHRLCTRRGKNGCMKVVIAIAWYTRLPVTLSMLMVSFRINRLNDETEGSTEFRAPRKLYRHPRVKRKGVYRCPRGSKSRMPRGFHRLRYLYYTAGSQSNRCLY